MPKVTENYCSSELKSSGIELATFERNYFIASLRFDNKYKTFETKIMQEP